MGRKMSAEKAIKERADRKELKLVGHLVRILVVEVRIMNNCPPPGNQRRGLLRKLWRGGIL
jgi:hypothetical protein